MKPEKKVLFVCTYNKMRSRTAEELYKRDPRFIVRSAGVDADATIRVSPELVDWAEAIVVMEQIHLDWFKRFFPAVFTLKTVINLEIPDEYYLMEPSLIEMVKSRFEAKWLLSLHGK